jgi:ATP-dependent exoDNAse (exonuclease V) beta subunit
VPVSYVTPSGTPASAAAGAAPAAVSLGDTSALATLWKDRAEARDRLQSTPPFESPTAYLHEPEKLTVEAPSESLVAGVGTLVGQVCHRVLEEWDYAKVDDLTDRIARAYQVLKQRFPVAYWSPVARESEKVLEEFLASPLARRLAKCDILGREVPFLMAAEGGKVIRGSIDLLFREGGRLWVADYKTDRIAPDQMGLHAQRYEPQGKAYAAAAEKVLGEKCGFQVIYLRLGQAVELIK